MKTPISSTEKRSARFGASPSNDFIDVRPKKSRRLLALGIGGLILAALFAAWVWQGPYQSWQDRKVVEKAMATTLSGDTMSTFEKIARQKLQSNPESVRYYLTSKYIGSGHTGVNEDAIEKAELAALREAARQGNELAALDLVKMKRTSLESNFKSISKSLDEIHERVQLGVRVGDPLSIYTFAVMKSEGLGTQLDLLGAAELATRVAHELPPGLQELVMRAAILGTGVYADQSNLSLAKSLGQGLLRRNYYHLVPPCALDRAMLESNSEARSYLKCTDDWNKEAALSGDPFAYAGYAEFLLDVKNDVSGALQWLEKVPIDVLSIEEQKLYLFLDIFENRRLRYRFHTFLSEKSNFTRIEDDGEIYFARLSRRLSNIRADRIGSDAGSLKAAAVYRAIYNLQSEQARQFSRQYVGSAKNAALRWWALFNNERVAFAGDALSKAIETKQGLNAALKQIDMLGQSEPARIQQAKPTHPEVVDKDYRAKSGPLGRQSASGGLSSFTVDNSQGDQDVVVRLYRDGKLPAVRSFVVKKGDTYTSEKIRAGNYVMRHRRIGSDTTYEADEVFRLVETPVEGGTQFSRMRVTIYKVTDGNLRTKEVPPDQF